jgi:5S rRNA maturation endonuclease (ribonuclease M5)
MKMKNNNLQAEVDLFHSQLPDRIKKWLIEDRGISEEILGRFKIGWDGKNLAIPIYDENSQYIYFKHRKDPQDSGTSPKYWFSSGGKATLYGWEHISSPKAKVIICEGELDRLKLETYGLPAISATAGAATFKQDWAKLIGDLPSEIFICYDNDHAGISGAEKIATLIPKARIVTIPESENVKDATDFINKFGIEKFQELLKDSQTLEEREASEKAYIAVIREKIFPLLSQEDLLKTLDLTIKEDDSNKLITFLCLLSAFTKDAQFNISFNAPSSSGKSYIPIEISRLFPRENRETIGYCSPTAFFHEVGKENKEKHVIEVDLNNKIIIFLDQPHTMLLGHLRPILSHDQNEISIKITDKAKSQGLRTKNIIIRGFPAVIFCSAGLKLDEQEATRFILLSPELTREKIKKAVEEKVRKEADTAAYKTFLDRNQERTILKERIIAIREEHIEEIRIANPDKIKAAFLENRPILKARSSRDVGRAISFIKVFALLNLWYRDRDGSSIVANDSDIEQGLRLWANIHEAQELNLPPYIHYFFLDVVKPCCRDHSGSATINNLMRQYYKVYGKGIPEWQLRKQIIPMLEDGGLILQEPDPDDKRRMLIFLAHPESPEQPGPQDVSKDEFVDDIDLTGL